MRERYNLPLIVAAINLLFIIFLNFLPKFPLSFPANPFYWNILGLIFIALGLNVMLIAQKVNESYFSKPKKVKKLITHGVYSNIRHPGYAGFILINLGVFFIFKDFFALVITSAFILFWYFLARFEEKILIRKYEKQYLEYMKKTPMFFPNSIKKLIMIIVAIFIIILLLFP